jgi:hypothetical protein
MLISQGYHYNTSLFFSRKIQMRCQLFPFFGVLSALAFAPTLTSVHAAGETPLDTAAIETITGLKGVSNQAEGTFKISKPRNDVAITVDQVHMAPFMGLTSWATFAPGMKDRVMVMGDMVLFEDEVNPVMSVALDKGLEVTALHNHFFFDEPKVYFMHIGGDAPADKSAEGVRAIFNKVKEIRAANPQPSKSFGSSALPEKNSIDGEAISKVFGHKGDANSGMYKVTIGREVKMPCGCDVGSSMGVNTWAAFAGTPDDALVVGDFAVLDGELQTVLKL